MNIRHFVWLRRKIRGAKLACEIEVQVIELMIHCFMDITSCRLVNSYRRFGGAWCPVHGEAATLLGVPGETLPSFDTSVNSCQSIQHNIPPPPSTPCREDLICTLHSDISAVYIYIYIPPSLPGRCGPTQVIASSFLKFLDLTQQRTTVGRTSLYEWWACRRDLCLTTQQSQEILTHILSRRAVVALEREETGSGSVWCQCDQIQKGEWPM
jgi:hypothetical protein